MTVRVTTLKGADAGVYYVEQLPSYYLDADEPRGVWLGSAAAELGLAGDVADEDFLALMGGRDPRQPDRHLGRVYDDQSVRGFDVTASAPKSVSTLWALGDEQVRAEVLAAHDAAVVAMAGWIERHAHTRYRIGGEVAVVDADGIVAAAFRQHTSRALDPQLHTHLVIPNRVKSPDGRWLALDARTIKRDQRTLSGIYHAGLRAELTARLGVRWHEPVNGISEIADVPEALLVEFSSRTGDVQRRIDEKLDRFVDTMNRDPTPRERWRLEREAVLDSRPAKEHSLDARELHERWRAQVRDLGRDPDAVLPTAAHKVRGLPVPDEVDRGHLTGRAVGELAEKQSTWRPPEILRELAAAVPTTTAVPAERLIRLLDTWAADATVGMCVDISKPVPPGAVLRRDGRPVTESATDRALTLQRILDEEQWLIGWTEHRRARLGTGSLAAIGRSQRELAPAQAEVAAALSGDADLVLVVGPAGAGKTTAIAPAVEQLRAEGRAVFGVAPSATAAEVLSAETGVAADTLDKLLIEHALRRPPDHRYDLPIGSTVVVDEAGMIPTSKLCDLADLADVRGWRLALIGDPAQFSAVGRGGMFGQLVETFGAIELDRVHRFDEAWEREASLMIRRGDPAAAEIYDEQQRLHGGTSTRMERAALERWWEHREAGCRTLLMAPSLDSVERLNQRAQQLRADAREIDVRGRSAQAGRSRVFAGDEIATRLNDRTLRTDRGEMVRNRAVWTVEDVHRDGSLGVRGAHGRVRLPTTYVVHHVDLAYACSDVAAQGQTVAGGVLFIDGPTDVRNLYVGMTRGTTWNEAFIATEGEGTAVDAFARYVATDWIDLPAVTRQAELQQRPLRRPGLLEPEELAALFARRDAVFESLRRAHDDVKHLPAAISEREHEVGRLERRLSECEAAGSEAAQVVEQFDRPLRRRAHDRELVHARQQLADLPLEIASIRRELDSCNTDLRGLDDRRRAATAVLREEPALFAELDFLDARVDADLRVRSRIARHDRTPDVIARLGPPPPGGRAAAEWDRRAGEIGQARALGWKLEPPRVEEQAIETRIVDTGLSL